MSIIGAKVRGGVKGQARRAKGEKGRQRLVPAQWKTSRCMQGESDDFVNSNKYDGG